MADSDYSFDGDDGSDDEYVGSRAQSASRTQAPGRTKAQPKATERKAHAWARRGSTPPDEEFQYIPAEDEDDEEDAAPQQTLQQIEEERKRKRYAPACLSRFCPSSIANGGPGEDYEKTRNLSSEES
jgi:transcription initiation factor TFIIH subunit 2